MNYNPYYFSPYMSMPAAKTGLFSSLFKGAGSIKWASILGGTQKVLNVANQAIPVIKQISPVMKNAKTMFKVMNEFKKVDTPTNGINKEVIPKESSNVSNTSTNKTIIEEKSSNEGPTFFI
ncbi:MAG: VrrA/YqfQ family protein [Bacilli bacterium]